MDMVFMILHNSKWFGMCIFHNIPQIKAVWNVYFSIIFCKSKRFGMCISQNIPQIKADWNVLCLIIFRKFSNDTRCKMEITMVYQPSDIQNYSLTILHKFQSL